MVGLIIPFYADFINVKVNIFQLSPSVFKEPESYKYKEEQMSDIREINKFLMKQGDTGTGLAMIRRGKSF